MKGCTRHGGDVREDMADEEQSLCPLTPPSVTFNDPWNRLRAYCKIS